MDFLQQNKYMYYSDDDVDHPSGVAGLLDAWGRSWRRTPIKQQKRTPPNKQGGVGRQQQHDVSLYN